MISLFTFSQTRHAKSYFASWLLCLAFSVPIASAQTAAISEIEVNQAIGKQFKGALEFVAGKDTVVRAFLDAEITVDPATTKLVVLRAGAESFELQAIAYDAPVKIVEFLCPNREACKNWAAGTYTFAATVNGVSSTTEGTVYDFKTRVKLRILVKPVKANYAGKIVTVRDTKWKTAVGYLTSVYPVAADGVDWDVQDEFDASDSQFDLETDAGRLGIWEALTNLVPQKCAANPKASGCYDLVVGFIPDRPMGYPNGTLQGYTYGRPTNIVVASDEDMEATVPHEIAHIYMAGDTYDGGSLNCNLNPAPDGFSGKDWVDRDKTTICTQGKTAFPDVSATLIPAFTRAYEVNGRGALGDMACYMGSGGKQASFWTSPEVYSAIFKALAPDAVVAPAKATIIRSAAAPERLLWFSGYLNKKDEVKKDPWYSYLATDIPVDSTGDLMLRALSSDNSVVATQRISITFFVNSNPPVSIENAPFTGAMRFPNNATKLQIVRRNDADASKITVLWESAVPDADPVVSAVFADAGETVDGPKDIVWTASTSSGKSLNYLVEFNPKSDDATSEWIVLAADISEPKWSEDFSFLPGGRNAKIRITATDGIRASATDSKSFIVPFKAPEVYIEALSSPDLKLGLDLRLSAEVEDVQDHFFPDTRLVWTSSISGPIGTGTDILAKGLPAGEHTITFTATNSVGLNASQSVKVTVK